MDPTSLVQIVAVAAARPVVALAELPDATASLHHQLLGHGHHNAEEVGILKRLGDDMLWGDYVKLKKVIASGPLTTSAVVIPCFHCKDSFEFGFIPFNYVSFY